MWATLFITFRGKNVANFHLSPSLFIIIAQQARRFQVGFIYLFIGLPTDLAWYLPDNASSCGGSWQDACTVGPLRVAQPCATISYQASLFAH